MLVVYLLSRRVLPRYAVMTTLLAGVVYATSRGLMQWEQVQWSLAMPVWTAPVFSWQASISLALPLFVVTMASQNLPGVAVIHSAGYDLPISKLVGMTGIATLLLAFRCLWHQLGGHYRRHVHGAKRRIPTKPSAIPPQCGVGCFM